MNNMATRQAARITQALHLANLHLTRSVRGQNKLVCFHGAPRRSFSHHHHSSSLLSCRHRALSPSPSSSPLLGLLSICSIQPYSTSTSQEVSLRVDGGLPVLIVPLPSRRELCEFSLRPLANNLADLTSAIKNEDPGVDRVAAYTQEGHRIALSTPIDLLLQKDFQLIINDLTYDVCPSQIEKSLAHPHDSLSDLSDVKNLVTRLYSSLHIEEHQLQRETVLLNRLHDIQQELQPMEDLLKQCEEKAKKRTHMLQWLGLGGMGFQFGLLARLTWYEYSWDIMEPVTYFVTYGTAMVMYAYFVLTKKEYNFCDVNDREYLLSLHRGAQKLKLDLSRYNQLRDDLTQVQLNLSRLRDPLQLQLPLQQINKVRGDYNVGVSGGGGGEQQ